MFERVEVIQGRAQRVSGLSVNGVTSLQINPSPGGDQELFVWVALLVPCSRRGWGFLQVPPGLSGMCRGTGCSLSLGLAIPSVQVASATSSSGCAQGWMGRSIYPFL